ncbi:MAG: histidine--tRNA ligase [Clostridia bacterium]|nr:histidine--tRNA ligase [Clostridia bacterium]
MIQKPKGTKDILPGNSYKWAYVEEKAKEILENYGFKEIRVPVFEQTELFERGVGDTTDVVQKEMYTFLDKGERSITLRPEGTAGVVRAYLENGMASLPSPIKMWYMMPMYRYENVQKGRYREFRQIGAEIIGSASYKADVELIVMADQMIKKFNIPGVTLNINSIGCPVCRAKYQEALKAFIGKNLEQYCDTCKTRFEKNPMRILDCKEKKCKELNQGAPVILDYLCEECSTHFENVKKSLETLNIPYKIDSGIVRGLDYYTKTVFEFVSETEGYTVLGGGRYDELVEELGGQKTPAIGFAMGEDRLIDIFEKYNKSEEIEPKVPDLYIASIGNIAEETAINLALGLRKQGLYIETDICERSMKASLKYADKTNSKYLLVIGEDEVNTQNAKIKDMKTGEEKEIKLDVDEIIKNIK